jgi:Co/Zn/Cd efflux system component
MATTAAVALAVNVFCASRLAQFKRGDASMRSIWLSTRNDAILNALTIAAAGAVAVTATGWPDIAAGIVIATINLWAAAEIVGQAAREFGAQAKAHPGRREESGA